MMQQLGAQPLLSIRDFKLPCYFTKAHLILTVVVSEKVWQEFTHVHFSHYNIVPIESMCGIFTYIWLMYMVNVGAYTSPLDP